MRSMYVLVACAVAGTAVAVFVSVDTNRPVPTATVPLPAQSVPFASYVAGTGITETGRGNVSIGTAVPGVVSEVYVRVGDHVKAGDPLFRIDDRDLQARLRVARADVTQASAASAKPRHRLEFLANLQERDRSAISVEALSNARDDASAADATLVAARALVGQIEVDIERSVVRAPAAGQVLQVNTRRGEFAGNGVQASPLILLGGDTRIYLRVDIDENDAWRVRPSAPAVAVMRDSTRPGIPLRFEYIEPYVVPKTSLTGQSTERSDQRVLQVIYSFEAGAFPVYVGQQMDAYIEAPPAGNAGTGGAH
jgi:HlyD family secretion protein